MLQWLSSPEDLTYIAIDSLKGGWYLRNHRVVFLHATSQGLTQVFINARDYRRREFVTYQVSLKLKMTCRHFRCFTCISRVRDTRELAPKSLHALNLLPLRSGWRSVLSLCLAHPWDWNSQWMKAQQHLWNSLKTTVVLLWLVRDFPLLPPFHHGYHILWIWRVQTFKRRRSLWTCLLVTDK